MKIKLTTILLFITSNVLFAQLDIRLNLDDLAFQKAALNLEMGYDKFSVELGTRIVYKPWLSVASVDSNFNAVDEARINRFAYIGSLRANFYKNPRNTLDGFHVSPTLDFMRQKVQFTDPSINTRVGASVLIGYKHMFGREVIGLQGELGLGYWFIDKTKFKRSGEEPTDEELIQDGIAGLFKGLRAIRMPFNITLNYRIGG